MQYWINMMIVWRLLVSCISYSFVCKRALVKCHFQIIVQYSHKRHWRFFNYFKAKIQTLLQAILSNISWNHNVTTLWFHKIFVGTYPGMAVMHSGLCTIDFYTIHSGNNPSYVAMLPFATCEGFLPALMVWKSITHSPSCMKVSVPKWSDYGD